MRSLPLCKRWQWSASPFTPHVWGCDSPKLSLRTLCLRALAANAWPAPSHKPGTPQVVSQPLADWTLHRRNCLSRFVINQREVHMSSSRVGAAALDAGLASLVHQIHALPTKAVFYAAGGCAQACSDPCKRLYITFAAGFPRFIGKLVRKDIHLSCTCGWHTC